ncbi:MAG: cell wall hydrolase [Muribaculaceae bacterium]|nr:cell wall hydrolase [Alistipes senegalensis]MCM1478754.1 cell wall hydrolase [Muribaculaceae bacterium]
MKGVTIIHNLNKKSRKLILRSVILLYLLLVVIATVGLIVNSVVYASCFKTEQNDKSEINTSINYNNLIVSSQSKTKETNNSNDNIKQTYYQTNYSTKQIPIINNSKASLTLYDKLTLDERHLIETVVQHEVGNFSNDYKILIAELIYNRLQSEEFPNDVYEVMFQENQFTNIEYWYSSDYEIDTETHSVVEQVFTEMNPSHDALYYYNPELSSYEATMWFEYSGDVEYLFSYSEESWGVTYETRFFK